MHLLYARMWTKVMFDAGLIKFKEPFPVLRNQGMIWAGDGQKMSKSKGNVVTPDAMVEKYGADALRLWELFMGPFEEATNWNEEGVFGTARYLHRVWSLVRRYVEAGCPTGTPSAETIKRAHKTIRTVTDQVERMRFNTALATLMDQLNYIAKLTPEELGRFTIESYVLMLAPMAPYVGEEFWRELGHRQIDPSRSVAEVRPGADARRNRHGRRAGQWQGPRSPAGSGGMGASRPTPRWRSRARR